MCVWACVCVCMYVFVLLSNFQVLFQHIVSSLYVGIYKSESMGELLSSAAAEPLASSSSGSIFKKEGLWEKNTINHKSLNT